MTEQKEMITLNRFIDVKISIYKIQIESVEDDAYILKGEGKISANTCMVKTVSGNMYTVLGSRKDILKQLGENE